MLIILDWDGTLMDSADRIAECLVKAGQELEQWDVDEEHAKQVIGLGLPEAVERLYPYLDKAERLQCIELYKQFFLEAEKQPCQLFPSVEETLEQLRESGHSLAIATGKSRQGLNRVLDQMDMHRYFDATRCADETASKPNPMMIDELLAEF
ncbi:MAG: HAD hydrolase-like protein, partial [Pseudomonadota bacterium]